MAERVILTALLEICQIPVQFFAQGLSLFTLLSRKTEVHNSKGLFDKGKMRVGSCQGLPLIDESHRRIDLTGFERGIAVRQGIIKMDLPFGEAFQDLRLPLMNSQRPESGAGRLQIFQSH